MINWLYLQMYKSYETVKCAIVEKSDFVVSQYPTQNNKVIYYQHE